ncbi:molybdopterin oxidoreductase [Candidatus Epulonipiscium fishelsonii]|uniref:Molybdopterin oxidoreductase n=1 Tax=Candidatus Epulonipiscium fishelsonii TaxID=77094 RepID=A0ACC8XDA5_9FIRM|nr:molybdopterin oxidoreductase [Epulopiscium sp. SCG-D08WGA-EpuloA1]
MGVKIVVEKEYICIICPVSCDLTLTDDGNNLSVSGNTCKRGESYAKNEYTKPVRMITTTVAIEGSVYPLIPVISTDMVPKEKLKKCIELLYNLKLQAPVKEGDVIVKDILDTGVDIIAAKTVKKVG